MDSILFNDRLIATNYVHEHNQNVTLSRGSQPKAFVESFGCQQNVSDSETLEGLLMEMGYTLCKDIEQADIVLYNTCAVRENAENTVFGNLGEVKHLKNNNPSMIIGVCGCMTQQKHIGKIIKESYPHVDLLFGAGEMEKLPLMVAKKLKEGGKIFDIGEPTHTIAEGLPVSRDSSFKAFVPIMTGCDNFCSYCIVPYVRGRERSREPQVIINEVQHLIDMGFKEITLLGQNVNSYGKGLENEPTFSSLLKAVADIDGKFRVRFMTSHPKDCTRELIDLVGTHPKISKHIHLPVQSGSNRILKLMNRGYTVEEYKSLISYSQEKYPEILFTSDIIIGFPGEDYEDFLETYKLVDFVGYSSLFTFAYSQREGTKAASFDGTITQREKTLRFDELLKLQRVKANEINQSLVGSVLEVLVDDVYKGKEGYLSGRTDSNIITIFPGGKELLGEFVNIEITNYMNWAVEGILADR